MPHPVAGQDILIIVASFMATCGIKGNKLEMLLKTNLVALPIVWIAGINQNMMQGILLKAPWVPNFMAGKNQCAYLIGLLLIISVCWLWSSKGYKKAQMASGVMAAIATIMLWQLQSRAALITTFMALAIVFLMQQAKGGKIKKSIGICVALAATVILSIKLMRPNSVITPLGFDFYSDLGRLQIQECFVNLPLTGNNRFIYGVGFERGGLFCKQEVISGVLDHAHNLYIQLWANAGILGIGGLLICLAMIVSKWNQIYKKDLTSFLTMVGIAGTAYTLIQGIFDASILYWPLLQVLTGVLIAIPWAEGKVE
jgi:O-antigen ligase